MTPAAPPMVRPNMTAAIDVARTAARAGARDVTVISLESRAEMPAHDFEVEEAEHEGISFVSRRGPARIVERDGKVVGIETIGVTSVFDENRRFAPVFDQDDRKVFDADTVILAIGQAIDVDALGESRAGHQPAPNDPDRQRQRPHLAPEDLGRWRRRQGPAHPDRRDRRRPRARPQTSTARSAATTCRRHPPRW